MRNYISPIIFPRLCLIQLHECLHINASCMIMKCKFSPKQISCEGFGSHVPSDIQLVNLSPRGTRPAEHLYLAMELTLVQTLPWLTMKPSGGGDGIPHPPVMKVMYVHLGPSVSLYGNLEIQGDRNNIWLNTKLATQVGEPQVWRISNRGMSELLVFYISMYRRMHTGTCTCTCTCVRYIMHL